MTLVIAQKKDDNISFSSDSRISFGELNSNPFDYGIKVFSIPVKIYSPVCNETGESTLDYGYSLGLAICGGAVNSYTIKESICEILQNLQYVPPYSPTMDSIAKLVFNVFKSVSEALFDSTKNGDSLSQIVLGGYCKQSNKIRVFKFSPIPSIDPLDKNYSYCHCEILKNEGDIEFFGTGRMEAISIFDANNGLTPLHIIKKVVQEAKIVSVGGALQFGEFKDNSFRIFGIAECESVNGNPQDSYQLRGMSLYKDGLEKGTDGLFVSYTCKMPFEEERKEIFDKLL
jgi:hypothetical protein